MEKSHHRRLDIDNIRALKVLGNGAMGTVFLAYDRSLDPSARSPFALKVVEKEKSLLLHPTKLQAARRARWETTVLSNLTHPFLPTLLATFETPDFMGWAVPYCSGGDLNVLRHHQNDRVFSTSVIRFYLAEIVCALGHLHSMGIVYRDLKPENVLIQQSGHVTLTDFDLSRRLTRKSHSEIPIPIPPKPQPQPNKFKSAWIFPSRTKSARVSPVNRRKLSFVAGERSNSFVGTEEYVAPEVVRGEGHEFAVDWWALGVLAYEMLYGKTPFRGEHRKETFRNVMTKRPEFMGKRIPLMDLIERLLEKEPTERLGYYRGASEIKDHEFFRGLRWEQLTEVLRPPFVPPTEDNLAEKLASGGFDVRDYFLKLRAPSSPLRPSSSRNLSLAELF